MKSIAGRLLVALFTMILTLWGITALHLRNQVTSQQIVQSDSGLREIAQLIVLSLPRTIADAHPGSGFELPPAEAFRGDKVSFQVWAAGKGLVFRSPDAPATPLKADLKDGFVRVNIDNEEWRVFALSDSSGQIQVHVGASETALGRELSQRVQGTFYAALLIFIVVAVAGCWVIQRSLKPMSAVRDAIRARSPSDLDALPTRCLPSEVKPLVDAFNELLGQLDTAIQGERRFIVDAAHELRTPLAALTVQADIAQRAGTLEEAQVALRQLSAIARRSARLSEQILDLALTDAPAAMGARTRIALHTLVVVVVGDFEVVAEQKDQRITLDVESCTIEGDVNLLGILLRNLVDNALRYTARGGHIAVSCRHVEEGAGRFVVLCVADDGPGVPEAEQERIFDRFYRVAGNAERGSGIGLSLVAQIARLHGAWIQVGAGEQGRGFGISVKFAALQDEQRL